MINVTSEYLASQGFSNTFPTRLWSRIRIAENGCWIWIASIDGSGYGSINPGRHSTSFRAHVAAWILSVGPIKKGQHVLHNCPSGDNKLCINPLHLYLGNNVANGRDRRIKNQSQAGESRYNAKLTWESVCIIRTSHKSQTQLAAQFGVKPSTINQIINKPNRWKRPR